MFETAELNRKVDRDEYERRLPALRTALLATQKLARVQVLELVAERLQHVVRRARKRQARAKPDAR